MSARSYATGFERVFDNPAGRHILALTRAAQRRTADVDIPRERTDDAQPDRYATAAPREEVRDDARADQSQ